MTTLRTLVHGLAAASLAVTTALAQGPAPASQPPVPPTPPASAGVGCPELTPLLKGPAATTATCRGNVLLIENGGELVRYTDRTLRDWQQLGRYRDANRTVSKTDVVFLGDSITDAWPAERNGAFFPGRNYVGRGISGQTTPQMLIRFRPDVLALKPKAVIILAGTNDIAGNTGPMTDEDIQNNLMSMAELAKANGVKFIFSSITPTSAYHTAPNGVPQTTTRPLARIRLLNDWMKKYAADNGHAYVDYFSAMIDGTGQMRAELTGDDLHPNKEGYAIMAPLAQSAIEQALR